MISVLAASPTKLPLHSVSVDSAENHIETIKSLLPDQTLKFSGVEMITFEKAGDLKKN